MTTIGNSEQMPVTTEHKHLCVLAAHKDDYDGTESCTMTF